MNKKKKLDQNTIQTAKRLLKYMTGTHKIQFIIVFICIFISSAASIAVSLSLKFLLDDFIIPLIGQTDPNFAELYKALAVLGCIFALGVIATFIYTRMMVYIGQGVLKSVRDDMFEHMQTPLFRPEYKRICHEPLYQRYRYPATDDQPGDPAGADGAVYDRGYLYFHVIVKSAAYDSGSCDYFYYAEGYQ